MLTINFIQFYDGRRYGVMYLYIIRLCAYLLLTSLYRVYSMHIVEKWFLLYLYRYGFWNKSDPKTPVLSVGILPIKINTQNRNVGNLIYCIPVLRFLIYVMFALSICHAPRDLVTIIYVYFKLYPICKTVYKSKESSQ